MQSASLFHHTLQIASLQGEVSGRQQSRPLKGGFLAGEKGFNFQPGQDREFRFFVGVPNSDLRGACFVCGDDQSLQHRQARQRTLAGRIIGKNQNGQTHVSFASQTRVSPPRQGK